MDASDHVMRVGTWKVFSLHHVCVFRGSVKARQMCVYTLCVLQEILYLVLTRVTGIHLF